MLGKERTSSIPVCLVMNVSGYGIDLHVGNRVIDMEDFLTTAIFGHLFWDQKNDGMVAPLWKTSPTVRRVNDGHGLVSKMRFHPLVAS